MAAPRGDWPDVIIERAADALIAAGSRLARRNYGPGRSYNGATAEDRHVGAHKVRVAIAAGLIGPPEQCSICEGAAAQYHSENYFRPLWVWPVCRSCHQRIHRRFGRSEAWSRFLDDIRSKSAWARALSTVELTRTDAQALVTREWPIYSPS